MGFFDEYYKADEPASMEYSHTDRFLWYLFGDDAEKMKHGAALSSAVRKELDSLFSTGGKPCRFPEFRRPFNEFSLEIKSTILLCTRITNLHKAVYIFGKCGGDGAEVLAEKFRCTCMILHAEYRGYTGRSMFLLHAGRRPEVSILPVWKKI